MLDQLSDVMDDDTTKTVMNKVQSNVQQIADDLNDAKQTVYAFADLTGSLEEMLDSTSTLLKTSGDSTKDSVNTLKTSSTDVTDLKDALSGTTDGINKALNKAYLHIINYQKKWIIFLIQCPQVQTQHQKV